MSSRYNFPVPSSVINLYKVKEDDGTYSIIATMDVDGNALTTPVEYVTFRGFTMKGYMKHRNNFTHCIIDMSDVVCNLTHNHKRINASNRIKRYWKRFIQKKREEHALQIIRPFLMHWAYKPTGPLGKMLINKGF